MEDIASEVTWQNASGGSNTSEGNARATESIGAMPTPEPGLAYEKCFSQWYPKRNNKLGVKHQTKNTLTPQPGKMHVSRKGESLAQSGS